MVYDDTSSTDSQQSERERWEIAHALSRNDQITINDEYSNLNVSHIRPNADSGTVTEVTLTTRTHDTYVIRVVNDDVNIPLLTRPDNEQIPITSLKPTNENILAATTVRDLYGSKITEQTVDPTDTYPEERNSVPDLNTDELNIIGECPSCNCLVAEHKEKAVCTSCGTWSPIEQWNAYYETQQTEEPTIDTGDPNLTQTSLTDNWDTETPLPNTHPE